MWARKTGPHVDYADTLENENIKVCLNVSHDNKDDAKSMGARWDTKNKKIGMLKVILLYLLI